MRARAFQHSPISDWFYARFKQRCESPGEARLHARAYRGMVIFNANCWLAAGFRTRVVFRRGKFTGRRRGTVRGWKMPIPIIRRFAVVGNFTLKVVTQSARVFSSA